MKDYSTGMKHEPLVSLERRWREQQTRQEQRSAGIERPVTSMNRSRSNAGHNHVVGKDLQPKGKSRGCINAHLGFLFTSLVAILLLTSFVQAVSFDLHLT